MYRGYQPDELAGMSKEEKMKEITKKFRVMTELWTYLSQKGKLKKLKILMSYFYIDGLYLPAQHGCTLTFL